MSWLNFYRIAYIAELIVFLTISPSFPCSPRAGSNTESGIFTDILHSNSYAKNESISESKVNI